MVGVRPERGPLWQRPQEVTGDRLGDRVGPELSQDVLDVVADGHDAAAQLQGDFLAGLVQAERLEDLVLAFGQLRERSGPGDPGLSM